MKKYYEVKVVNKPPTLDADLASLVKIDHDTLTITLSGPITPLTLTSHLMLFWAQYYDVDVGTPPPVAAASETLVPLINGWRISGGGHLSTGILLLEEPKIVKRNTFTEPEPEPKKSLWQRFKDLF
jgi:hypothetical protein